MTTETLWRVTAKVGYGWPLCYYRESETRRFTSARAAHRWIANLQKLPSHHQVESVEFGTIEYRPVALESGEVAP